MLKALLVAVFVFGASQFCTALKTERVAVSFPKDETIIIVATMEKCIIKTGAAPNAIDVIRSGEVLEDETFKEFFYCAAVNTGYANSDGLMKIKKCIELFPKETQPLVEPVFKNCVKEGTNKYDTIFKFLKCFQETSPVRVAL